MTIFNEYARYYDLLYRDKDYAGEADYVAGLLRQHHPAAKTILDLGCGTGNHALCLSKMGYAVTGVDRSDNAIAMAWAKQDGLAEKMCFETGDIRTLRLGGTYDAVVSLFHVMSYQTTDADLDAAFGTAAAHAAPGALFVFDCWYGPGVLSDRPGPRIKTVRDGDTTVIRLAEPRMLPNENSVQIDYRLLVCGPPDGVMQEIRESHRMRYLFLPEIHRLFCTHGFEVACCEHWLTGGFPGFDTWNLCCIGRKKA